MARHSIQAGTEHSATPDPPRAARATVALCVTLPAPSRYNPTTVMRPANDLPLDDEGAADFVVDNAMLTEALTKARRLVSELERQHAEVQASPPDLPPDQLAQGKFVGPLALFKCKTSLIHR